MTVTGVDIAWARPTVQQIKDVGAHFVARYLSPDSSKNITRTEVQEYVKAGISIVVVWESVAQRMRGGYSAGAADARAAEILRAAVGLPNTMPIYFACDFDAQSAQYHEINEYMRGVNSVIGLDRSGIYGGYYVVNNVVSAPRRAQYVWQTTAWSNGHWSTHANIRQTGGTTLSGGADKDIAEAADYGQYPRSGAPKPAAPTPTTSGGEMELNSKIRVPAWLHAEWPTDKGIADGYIAVGTALGSGYGHARAAHDGVDEIRAELSAVKTMLAEIAKKVGIDGES